MNRKKITIFHNSGDGDVSLYQAQVTNNEINNQRIKLSFHKDDTHWTETIRGKTAVKLHDNGNGVKIKFRDRDPIELDYSEVSEMYMLLSYYQQNSGFSKFIPTYKKFKEIK